MKLTEFTFFKNTPLIDFQNTIHFGSSVERDAFFLEGGHYDTLETSQPFNYIRDRSSLTVDIDYHEFAGVNYCTFLSDFEPHTRFYAYVTEYEYLNDGATRVNLLIDGIMTFTQGSVLQNMKNLTIQRQHLPRYEYENRLWQLKNNGDIIKTSSKQYVEEKELIFDELVILIQSSADLRGDFGTEDDPKIKTSEGITFDKISSPLELYVVEQKDFKDFMEALHPFPWIAQNISSMSLMPKAFIKNKYEGTATKPDFDFNELNVLRDGAQSNNATMNNELNDFSYSIDELCDVFGLDKDQDQHLLRSEYTTTEVYTFNGQQLLLDNGLLNPRVGLQFNMSQVIGFHNEVHFYVRGYQTDKGMPADIGFKYGTFLNNSISFDQFDDVPMLVDNYNLALANNANQRELAESQQPTNRVENVMDSSASLKDRFMDAGSLIGDVASGNIFGKFNDEHNFYKQQQAEFADLALATPTVTNQGHGNSLQIANDFFGLHLKFSAPTEHELDELRKYYKLFGYEVNENGSQLNNLHSMTICNYVQFKGSWTIDNADVAIIEMMKAQFENGVRLWHNNDTPNPMAQNPLDNKIRG